MDELKVELLSEKNGSQGTQSPLENVSKQYKSFELRVRNPKMKKHRHPWMYPALGESKEITAPSDEIQSIRGAIEAPKHQLSEWPSTAICGNDILASVLYSSGIVAGKAGKLTPVTQLLVAVVLHLFRYIYEEAVTAIPLNGGSYNVLLNTTSKRTAAIAATLGIISYLATGVVSGTSAISYLNTQVEVPMVFGTISLLLVFAILSIIGIAESATVALVIFIFHVATLTILAICSCMYAFNHTDILGQNMNTDFPDVDVAGSILSGNVLTAIFFGYSTAMLGITGFETSAQFVEEQQPGVFRKTLKNMWLFATVYNFLLSFLAMAVLPLEGPEGIYENKNIVLAMMGLVSSGHWLQALVSIDAFVVLAGGVLTSYVGITGLVRRLAFDRVLPSFLAIENECRKTNHYIILLFFAVQSSLVLILNADATILAGVFTFSFLGVMSLFAFGCIMLKLKREEIPRDVHAPWWSCIFGLIMVLLGLLGNLLGNPEILTYFALYFIIFASIMFLMLERVFILRIVLFTLQQMCPSRKKAKRQDHLEVHAGTGAKGGRTIIRVLQEIHLPSIVFFCKRPELSIINKAILYVRKNEQTHNLRIVHVCDEPNVTSQKEYQTLVSDFTNMAAMFDVMYPKLKIDFIAICVPGGKFDKASVQWISQHLKIPPNMMFLRQPSSKHIHQVSSLGVRVITG